MNNEQPDPDPASSNEPARTGTQRLDGAADQNTNAAPRSNSRTRTGSVRKDGEGAASVTHELAVVPPQDAAAEGQPDDAALEADAAAQHAAEGNTAVQYVHSTSCSQLGFSSGHFLAGCCYLLLHQQRPILHGCFPRTCTSRKRS